MRRKVLVLCGVAFLLLISAQVAAASSTTRVRFEETTDSTMYGVHASWDHPLMSQSISCPNNYLDINYIDAFVRGNQGSMYIASGARYQKQNTGSNCGGGARQMYYSEWDIGSGTSGLVYLVSIADGAHDYALNQLSGDWRFRVDGGSTLDFSNWTSADIADLALVRMAGLCYRTSGGTDCDSTGKLVPASNFTYKPSASYSGTWPDWAGKDSECVDYAQNARGKWDSATSADLGFNVTISGSLTGPSC